MLASKRDDEEDAEPEGDGSRTVTEAPAPVRPSPRPPSTRPRSSSGRSRSSSYDRYPSSRRRSSRSRSSRRRSRSRRILKWVLLGIGVPLILAGVVLADAYYQADAIADPLEGIRFRLSEARAALSHGKLPEGDPFTEATEIAQQAREDAEATRFTFDLVGKVPFFNRPVLAVGHQVEAAERWSEAATVVRDMVTDLLGPKALRGDDRSGGDQGRGDAPVMSDGRIDVDLIESLPARLETLIGHLEAADRAIRAMPTIPLYPRLAELKEKALVENAQELQLARDTLSAARVLPSFLGAESPRTYFLALQNGADLRGTGGAVLAYGFIRIDNGELDLTSAGSITEIEDRDGIFVDLPEAVAWYIRAAQVNPRLANGANYSPDMPVVSQAWAAMIEKVTGIEIDGVVAMDPTAIAYALGQSKVKVRSYPEEITGENFVEVVENAQYRLPKEDQEVFPEELIAGAWHFFQNPHPFVKTVQQLGVALREKHVQIWSRDPEEQELMRKLKWDGGLRPPIGGGDYVYLVDNKRISNKVDYYTKQRITYDVTLNKGGSITSDYHVVLTNDIPPDQPAAIAGRSEYGKNVAMLNLYVPKRAVGASVDPAGIATTEDIDPLGFIQHTEKDFLVLTQTIESLPGDPGELRFRYTVPKVVKTTEQGRVYQLTVQHQPLVNDADLTINVHLPEDAEVTSAEGWTVKDGVATFHTTLTQDLTLPPIVF